MGRPQDQMSRIGQHRRLGLGRCTPEHIYNGAVLGIDSLQDGIRELLPAMVPVGIGLMCSDDCQDRIEEQDALFRPGCQTAVIRNPASQVIMKFLINIDQRRRDLGARLDRKAKPVGLVVPMIGILSQDDCLDSQTYRVLCNTAFRIQPGPPEASHSR